MRLKILTILPVHDILLIKGYEIQFLITAEIKTIYFCMKKFILEVIMQTQYTKITYVIMLIIFLF